ncbi:hypothetical protein ACFLQN_03445 [Candidatus Aenigmatarchaeota archaeon]
MIIFALLVIFSIVELAKPIEKTNELLTNIEIETAKLCLNDDDCVVVSGREPFGCFIAINRHNIDNVIEDLDGYETITDCGHVFEAEAKCVNKKCEIVE